MGDKIRYFSDSIKYFDNWIGKNILEVTVLKVSQISESACLTWKSEIKYYRMIHAVDWFPTILNLAGLPPGEIITYIMKYTDEHLD